MTARARVQAFFEGTRAALRPRAADELVHRLALESGLSIEGVRHALTELLELEADDAEVDAFVLRAHDAGEAPAAAVVLSSNVFTAGFRAIAWALARAPRVVVRPSRRGRLFPTLLASATRGSFELSTASDEPAADLARLRDELPSGACVHVYGAAEAIASARTAMKARPDLQLELHGPGFGIVIAEAGAIVAQADAIALDVAAFDQRGCLSPRLVLAIGPRSACSTAADALHAALDRIGARIPRGTATPHEAGALRLAHETAAFHGRALEGREHLVLDLGDAPDAPIGPTFRALPVVAVPTIEDALRRVARVAAGLTVIGAGAGTIDDSSLALLAPRARVVALGTMQKPPFALGPVDGRAG